MAKAKVTIRGIGDAKNNLLKQINSSIKDPGLLDDIGKTTVEQIRNRTRGRLEEYKQKELTDYTKAYRQVYLDNFGGKGELSKANRSNLTLSGQLLDAIKYTIQASVASVVLSLKDSRYVNNITKTREQIIKATKFTGNKDKNRLLGAAASQLAKKETSVKTNSQIKEDLEKQGREFLFVSDKLKANLESKISRYLRRSLQIYNRIRRKLS